MTKGHHDVGLSVYPSLSVLLRTAAYVSIEFVVNNTDYSGASMQWQMMY